MLCRQPGRWCAWVCTQSRQAWLMPALQGSMEHCTAVQVHGSLAVGLLSQPTASSTASCTCQWPAAASTAGLPCRCQGPCRKLRQALRATAAPRPRSPARAAAAQCLQTWGAHSAPWPSTSCRPGPGQPRGQCQQPALSGWLLCRCRAFLQPHALAHRPPGHCFAWPMSRGISSNMSSSHRGRH